MAYIVLQEMNPTHCFVRIQVRAISKSAARDALDVGYFANVRFDDKGLLEIEPGLWRVDVPFSYEGSENVAEGDLEDDIAPDFPALMQAKSIYGAEY